MFNTVNKDFHKQRVTQQMIRSVKRSHFNCITFHRDGLCPLPFQSSTLIHSNPTWLIWQKHFCVAWIMILKRHVDLVTMALWIFGHYCNILHWYALVWHYTGKWEWHTCSDLQNTLAQDIIGETAFGRTFNMLEGNDHLVPRNITKTMETGTYVSGMTMWKITKDICMPAAYQFFRSSHIPSLAQSRHCFRLVMSCQLYMNCKQ